MFLRSTFLRLWLALAVIAVLFPFHAPSSAQADNPTRRISLIIGNSDYNLDGAVDARARPPDGMLSDLVSACNDAHEFARSLRRAGWSETEILGGAKCNLTALQMLGEVLNIVEQLSAPAPGERILAIIYFAGHGAQFGDGQDRRQFLFGAGARYDVDRVVGGMRQAPGNTGYLATQAVDLTDILSRVGHQFDNSLWIITDACRNNALYGSLQAQLPSLRISSIWPQNIDFSGVVMTYPIRGGLYSRDDPMRGSVFAATLREMLNPNTELDDILNLLPKRVHAAYDAIPGNIGSQVPDSVGRFVQSWCVWQCPEEPVDRPSPPRSVALTRSPTPPFEIAASLAFGTRPAISPIELRNFQTGSSPRPHHSRPTRRATRRAGSGSPPPGVQMRDRVVFARPGSQTDGAAQRRGLRVDVFWCDEIPGAAERFARAMVIAERLGAHAGRQRTGTLAEQNASLSNELNLVRLRRLSLAANLYDRYRYAGDFVIVDDDSPDEARLAEFASTSRGHRLSIRNDGQTPDYVSIVICQAPRRAETLPRIFIQVPAEQSVPLGRELRGNLLQAFPGAIVSSDIDVVAESPTDTEVRFYHAQDRDLVFQAASALETKLDVPVRIRYFPEYSSVTRIGQMEVWMGSGPRAGGLLPSTKAAPK